jgi:hypothetical protein
VNFFTVCIIPLFSSLIAKKGTGRKEVLSEDLPQINKGGWIQEMMMS